MPSKLPAPSLDEIDWAALSDRATVTLQRIAVPYAAGLQHAEIAALLGISEGAVSVRLRELREELSGQVTPCRVCGEPIAESRSGCSPKCRAEQRRRARDPGEASSNG